MQLDTWVKLPTAWIESGGLRSFHWRQSEGSSGAAGLMVLMVLAHHADQQTGVVRLTYDNLTTATGLSRTKVSHGLNALVERDIVTRLERGRGTYQLVNFDPTRSWGKLPARPLYQNEQVQAFRDFHVRRVAELDALKAYLAFVARRNNRMNLALMSYYKIEEYAAIPRNRIKSAISLLAVNSLVYVEQVSSTVSEHGVSNAYRLAHLDAYRHMGTRGRRYFDEEQLF